MHRSSLICWIALIMLKGAIMPACAANAAASQSPWINELMAFPYPASGSLQSLQLLRQDYEALAFNQSVVNTPLKIGTQSFTHGLGTHSVSQIRVFATSDPIVHFSAWVGVDNNPRGVGGTIDFRVAVESKEFFKSAVLKAGDAPVRVDVAIDNQPTLDLFVGDGGDGSSCDHADWAEAAITTKSGATVRLDQLQLGSGATTWSRYPFSFIYGGQSSNDLLPKWQSNRQVEALDADRTRITTTWLEPATQLKVECTAIQYTDFPALEWLLHFENAGQADTPILENIQAMDARVATQGASCVLHRTNGAPANPTDFEPSLVEMKAGTQVELGGGGGRSSNKDFPFYKVDLAGGSFIVAVGWSGQWKAVANCLNGQSLHLTAGLELTHFKLHPGERVRMPRMLVLDWAGKDPWEANARFRRLITKHYAARRVLKEGGAPELLDPTPFCNTCFTRGGGWLNETTAANQISLIRAYAPLGLEALWTDAGWFEGGWPAGAGNWTPRKDNYPDGMGPVAQAAKENNMIYGLWFEPERVMQNTDLQKNHPDWLLPNTDNPGCYLLNWGNPATIDYFFNIVDGFMKRPGFRVYRQDFNMDPLAHWRQADTSDRQGITEIKFIEGLYAYWDRIAAKYPDSLREECASGGRRIDLETVMRMHLHQDSDYWFDYEVDQAQGWGLSQYLPNNVFVQHLSTLETYDFHSVLANSLCLGWIADGPSFDSTRGRTLLARYRAVRHLFTGAWYPLLPYTRDGAQWMAEQYDRPDLGEGLLLAFRHKDSPYPTVEVSLHGLDPVATYELIWDSSGEKKQFRGADLMNRLPLSIAQRRGSELITYKKVKTTAAARTRYEK